MTTYMPSQLHDAQLTVAGAAAALDDSLDKCSCGINDKCTVDGISDWTPLNIACYHKNWGVAMFLVERGADVNTPNEANHNIGAILGITPLMNAIGGRDRNMSLVLLTRGANPNIMTTTGNTALMTACIYQDEELVSLLLGYGSDINIADNKGRTAYSFAVSDSLKHLLQQFVRKHDRDKELTLNQSSTPIKLEVAVNSTSPVQAKRSSFFAEDESVSNQSFSLRWLLSALWAYVNTLDS